MSAPRGYAVDPADPRAPALDIWERLSRAERERVMAELPSELELGPPEGDGHRIPKQRGLEALDAFFRRAGRRVYLSSELPVYYPGARMFAPDLIAVCDVEPHERMRWVVAHENKGLDLALEVTLEGSRKKDLEENVARFAELGIPEYFVFDRRSRRLHGWRLEGKRAYVPIVPQAGRWRAEVLGLDLGVEGDRFRFYAGSAVLPESAELVQRANQLVDELHGRLSELEAQLIEERAAREQSDAEKTRAEAERAQAQAEKNRAEAGRAQAEAERAQAELRLRELEAELARLKGRG